MKVILTQDVPNLGKRFDVKDVSDGHAVNFLIPRGFVREATKGALAQAEAERSRIEAERKVREDLLLKNLNSLENVVIHVSGKANDQGHLFASIHKEDIAKRLKDEAHLDVDPRFIELAHPLKAVGEHEVTVSVQDEKTKFKVIVEKTPE